jgi:ribosomal protein S27AE
MLSERKTTMKQVYATQTPPEAHMVKGFLETNGILAIVQGDNLVGLHGGIPITPATSSTVWVAERDFDQALALVDDFFHGEAAEGEPGENWYCPVCGEVLEAQFTECWNCGASRYTPTDEQVPPESQL